MNAGQKVLNFIEQNKNVGLIIQSMSNQFVNEIEEMKILNRIENSGA